MVDDTAWCMLSHLHKFLNFSEIKIVPAPKTILLGNTYSENKVLHKAKVLTDINIYVLFSFDTCKINYEKVDWAGTQTQVSHRPVKCLNHQTTSSMYSQPILFTHKS